MSEEFTGRIVKALSGFYYVKNGAETVECHARGKLRTQEHAPLVGDLVRCSRSCGKGMIEQIEPRRNSFVRPAVSNLDALVILASCVIPVTEPFLIDRVAAIAGHQNVPVIVCVNKSDLDSGERLVGIYQRAGFQTLATSAETGEGIDVLRQMINRKTVAFTGNSGVGKSSVLARMCPGVSFPTGEVSKKLGRGRHTTRHVELFSLGDDTYAVDTPGFSSFDTERMDLILKESLQYAFADFAPYLGTCRFHDCAHLREPGCAVLNALHEGKIEPTRHESYVKLYEQASRIKLWEYRQAEQTD